MDAVGSARLIAPEVLTVGREGANVSPSTVLESSRGDGSRSDRSKEASARGDRSIGDGIRGDERWMYSSFSFLDRGSNDVRSVLTGDFFLASAAGGDFDSFVDCVDNREDLGLRVTSI